MRTKRTTSRLLSVLLCLVMVLGLLPTAAFAANAGGDDYPNIVGILKRKQGTKNILNAQATTIAYTADEDFEHAGMLDASGKKIEYDDWEAAKKAGCVAYLDAKGVYHFVNDVTDNTTYKTAVDSYANHLAIGAGGPTGNYEGGNKFKCIVHKDVTVNLKALRSYREIEIELQKGSKLIINFDRDLLIKENKRANWKEVLGNAVYATGDLTITGDGTLIVNSSKTVSEFSETSSGVGIKIPFESNNLYVAGNVNLEVNAYQKEGSSEGINVSGNININTTGYVKVSNINLTSTNVNAIKCGGFRLQNASYVELSSAYRSDYGYLIFDQDYKALGKNTWSFPAWNIETTGSEVSFDGISSSLLKLKKSYAKFTRDGVSGAKLTPYGGTEISSLGKATITPGTKTFTITATAEEWLKTLVKEGRAEYTLAALVYKNGEPLYNTYDVTKYTVTPDDDSNGDPTIKLELTEAPKAGDVYSIAAFVKPVAKGTESQLCDSAYGTWTLNVVNELTAIPNAPIKMSAALTPGSTAPKANPYSASAPYSVESTTWYSEEKCETEVTSFTAGTMYYAKVVLKPNTGYKFAGTAQTPVSCDDPNASYSRNEAKVAEDGSSMSVVVKATARAALTWDSSTTDGTSYSIKTLESKALTAKAVGGDTSKSISYQLIAKKDGTETVKSSGYVSAAEADSKAFSTSLSFKDPGTYECWFKATRGDVTIESKHFTVTVSYPGLTITNQSGDMTVEQNGTARLFVIVDGVGLKYQWQVKDGDTWKNVSGTDSGTDYDYAAPTDDPGTTTYRCKITDKGGSLESNEMTVTVLKGNNKTIAAAQPIATVNGLSVIDPVKRFGEPNAGKVAASFNSFPVFPVSVVEEEQVDLAATYSMLPRGYRSNEWADRDFYSTYADDNKTVIDQTPVFGSIAYEWGGTTEDYQTVANPTYSSLGSEANTKVTIPSYSALTDGKYYVKLTVTNTVKGITQPTYSYVILTFNVSQKHTTHTYTDHYAQLNETQHYAYCACGASITKSHDNLGADGACSKCGYTPAKTYSISVTKGTASATSAVAGTIITLTANAAPAGQEFDKWVGNVTVTKSGDTYSFTMPSYNVELYATYKSTGSTHHWNAWEYSNEYLHKRTCSDTGCTAKDYDFHTYPDTWTNDTVTGKHTRTCTAANCTATESADHKWGNYQQLTAPTLTTEGEAQYECSAKGCGTTKTETIDKLKAISEVDVTVTAPVRGNTPEDASTDSSATTYYVADTQWTPAVSGTFAGGTKYTVKVSLEAMSGYRFTSGTTFKINGQTATIVGSKPGADGVEDVAISYEFPATSSGSSSGGGGGSSSSTYTVTVKDAKHGSVTADRKTATSGATVTLTVSPDQGWTLETLTATNAGGKEIDLNIVKIGETYTFKMPSSNVTVNATFMEDNTILNYFVDVPIDSYYYDAVLWAVEQGITQGTDNSHFNPSGICTRAQAVTFLWRAAGSPTPKSSTMPFTDVKSGVYYYDAVLWAVENGITKGTTDTTFSPNMNCSRAQIVTFLWRSEKSPAAGTVNPFTDVKADAYYADAVLWAVKEDVTKGTTDTTFSPDANCTRSQIVTFIYRCMK